MMKRKAISIQQYREDNSEKTGKCSTIMAKDQRCISESLDRKRITMMTKEEKNNIGCLYMFFFLFLEVSSGLWYEMLR